MNVLPSVAKTPNPESDDAKVVNQVSTAVAPAITIPTNPAPTQFEKNHALTGPAGPSGVPALLLVAKDSDESRELASARIF